MRKMIFVALAATFSTGAAYAAPTPTITYTDTANVPPSYTSAKVVESFDTTAMGPFKNTANEVATGNVQVVNGSLDNSYKSPATTPADNTNYLAVLAGGTFTYTFNTAAQFVSFTVGSLDTFNQVILTYVGGATTTLVGGQIIGSSAGINGATQQSGTVAYNATGGVAFQSIAFSTTANSFEIDTIAAAAPEPATWGMMILGFGLAGSALRRRRGKTVAAFA